MKKLLLTFLILFIATALGFMIHKNTGYVMVVYQHWVVTTNIWVAAITVLISFIGLYAVIRLLKNTFLLPKRLRKFSRNHRAQKKQTFFMTALSEFAIGNYSHAEKKFIRAISRNTPISLHYLAAAYCAQARGAIAHRDKYLSRALQKAQHNELPVKLTEAELYLKNKAIDKALSLLLPLTKDYPKNIRLLQLLSACYQKSADWQAWLLLLPELKKHQALSEKTLKSLEIATYSSQFNTALRNEDNHLFESTWEMASKAIKQHPDIIRLYLSYCHKYQAPHVAQSFIESLMKQEWRPSLLLFYVKLGNQDIEKLTQQLNVAETWLRKHGEDATLLTILAHLSFKTNFPGKASDYADKALLNNPDDKTSQMLADVFNNLGSKDNAIMCYQKALA